MTKNISEVLAKTSKEEDIPPASDPVVPPVDNTEPAVADFVIADNEKVPSDWHIIDNGDETITATHRVTHKEVTCAMLTFNKALK